MASGAARPRLAGGLASNKPPLAVAWEANEVALVAPDWSGVSCRATRTPPTGHAQAWQSVPKFTPTFSPFGPQDRSALAKKNTTPYLVWLEKTTTNAFVLKSRVNPTQRLGRYSYTFPQADIDGITLVKKDLLDDGTEEIVVAFMTQSSSPTSMSSDPQTLAIAAQSGPGTVRNANYTPFMSIARRRLGRRRQEERNHALLARRPQHLLQHGSLSLHRHGAPAVGGSQGPPPAAPTSSTRWR